MSTPRHDQWKALTEGCAAFPLRRRFWRVTGEDRVNFLQGMLTNDVRSLEPGCGMAAAHLDRNGKIITDLRVYADKDEILLDVPAGRAEALREALERFLVADDVEIAPADEQPLAGLEGARAAELLARVFGAQPPVQRFAHSTARLAGTAYRLIAASEVGRKGFVVAGPENASEYCLSVLRAAGAVSASGEVLEILRVESGVPRYGVDMTEDNLVMEVGLADAISFTKGCYLGQEVVERIAARGHVNRRLCGLLVDGDVLPAPGTVLRAGGREAGHVTSAVRSIALDRVIALGYVRRDHWDPGTALDAGGARATVTALPFVRTT